jgi:hypothetical protein
MTFFPRIAEQIEAAFTNVPRPPNRDLLDPSSYDDGDAQSLYTVEHWREAADADVQREWAALFFLSAAGFQHFLPAYMLWSLHHAESGAAVIETTVLSLTPAYSLKKFAAFDDAQRAAVVSFLEAMAPVIEVEDALEYWYGLTATDEWLGG